MAGTKIKVVQTRSRAGRDEGVKGTLKALGLGRINSEREHVTNPCLLGMLRKVEHLVKVTIIK